jgi:hypothetical protein
MIDPQTLLFPEDTIDTLEARQQTTIQDLIRELISIGIEVDIANDMLIEGDVFKAKKTLDALSTRIETFITNIR